VVTAMLIESGLCAVCRHAKTSTTKRGTTYLRCTRASWDDRLVRYPRLPVLRCVGFEAGGPTPGDA
jgi:hypothetical protein